VYKKLSALTVHCIFKATVFRHC